MPLILSGQYATGPHSALSLFLFFVQIVASSYLIGYVRLKTGSIWPAVWAHALWNTVIQGVFDACTKGVSNWVGESGMLTAIGALSLALLLVRGRWSDFRRSPSAAPEPLPCRL